MARGEFAIGLPPGKRPSFLAKDFNQIPGDTAMNAPMVSKLAGAWFLCLACSAPQASTYPSRSITIVVSSAPGGALDTVSRIVGNQLAKGLDTPVVIENRPGANASIGASAVARARPDGYTLLATSENALTIVPALMPEVPYDVRRDFTPISLLATLPMVVVASPSSGLRSLDSLLDTAKRSPGKLRFGSAGDASVHYVGMALLQKAAGIGMMHVPYRAGPQAMNDVMAGNIDTMLLAPGPAEQQRKAGRMQALGVTSARRLDFMPDVPAVAETLPGYTFEAWFGLLAPAGLPADVRARLHAEVARVLALPEVSRQLADAGIVATSCSPAEFARRIAAERDQVLHTLRK